MAITISTQPGNYRLTRDIQAFVVTGTDFVITEGVKHEFVVSFTQDPEAGDTLAIASAFIDPEQVFSFVGPPFQNYVFNGEDIRIRTGGVTIEDWIDSSVIPGLMANALINEHYELYRDGTNLVIRALEFGPAYNLTNFLPSGFTVSGSNTAGVLPEYTPDYKIRARVNLETAFESTEYHRSPWYYFTPDANGQLQLDLSQKLDELFHWPEIITTFGLTPQKRTQEVRRFFVEFSEWYGEDPLSNPIVRSSLRTVMKGASRAHSLPTNLLEAKWAIRQWLTGYTQAEWDGEQIVDISIRHTLFCLLNWTNQNAGGTLRSRARVFYTDGSSQEQVLQPLTGARSGELWCVQCGFFFNGLQNLSSETPYAYEIEVIDDFNNAVIVFPFRFRIVTLAMSHRRIWFRNRFGVSQMLMTDGDHIEEMNPVRSEMRAARKIPTVNDHDTVSFDIQESTRLTIGSGAFNDYNSDNLLDLVMSAHHIISPAYNAGNNIPARIINQSEVLRSYTAEGVPFKSIALQFELIRRR